LAEALAGAVATGGVIQSVQNVLSTVAGYVKEIVVQVAKFGRQVIRISYYIAKEVAKPEVGVPFAILVYNVSKFIRFDKAGVISAINSYFESIKAFNPVGIVWDYIRSGLSRIIDVSKVNNYWDLLNPFIAWDAISNSPIAPKLEVNVLGYTIDLSVIPRVLMFIPLYLVFELLCIPMFILNLAWEIIRMIIEALRIIITSIVGFVIDVLGWVGNLLSWLACTYLKIVQPIIPIYFGAKNIGRGFRRAITSAVGGTLLTWVMMYAFAPECVSLGIPSFPSPAPVSPPPMTPSPALPPIEYAVVKSIKSLVSTTSLRPAEIRIDKSLKTQFLWSGVGVTEYAVNKVLRPSVATEITELVLSTIDKTIKASVEYGTVPVTEYIIDRSVMLNVVTETVELVSNVIDKPIKPVVEYTTIGGQVIEKTLKAYVEHQITTVASKEIVKTISTSVSYEAPVGMIQELIITGRLKPSVSQSTGIEVIEVSDSNITVTMPVTQISTGISREEQGVVNTLVTTQISVEKVA
jgi:hypothetical protein